MTEESPFLTRKPRIWLIGDPDKLGFKETRDPKHPWGPRTRRLDKFGADWVDAVDLITKIIMTVEKPPYGVYFEWLGEELYLIESPKLYVPFDKQGYAEFDKLVSKAKDGDVEPLFDYSPPIKKYMIPRMGTKSRFWFSLAAKAWGEFRRRILKKRTEIQRKLGEVLEDLKMP